MPQSLTHTILLIRQTFLKHLCMKFIFLESDLPSILESAASVATALNVPTQPLIVPKVEASTLDDLPMDHDGDYKNVIIKTEDGEQQQQQHSLLICPICGNEAGKHVHYGGRACTSCRAFFRRSGVNFINIKCANFLYKCQFSSFFSSYVYVKKAAETTFVRKIRTYNVDEIDGSSTRCLQEVLLFVQKLQN